MGRISDFFRLAWGLLYWNARKSAHLLGGRRGRCPCQHPSDSGRAGETACAAVASWKDPARFRRLCPLLRQNAYGLWRCSVDAADVRPFWGRATAFYGTLLAGGYLAVALAAFVFLREVGYHVTYPGVLWPPAWNRLDRIRSEFFYERFRAAAAAGDMQTALLSLANAYGLDPANLGMGMQLAQFWQVSHPAFSDNIYARLLRDHPAQAEATAQVWFRAMLARGDFKGVESLAAARIAAAPDKPGAWLTAFLFANRRTGDAATRAKLLATPGAAPSVRLLAGLLPELDRITPEETVRARLLAAASETSDPLAQYALCRELIARGFARAALRNIDERQSLFSPRDLAALRMDAFARLEWRTTLASDIDNLLAANSGPAVIELLAAHLIRVADARVAEHVFSRIKSAPPSADQTNYPAYLALLCAAIAERRPDDAAWTVMRIKESLAGNFRALETASERLLAADDPRRFEDILPLLNPLSIDVAYALLDRSSTAPR